MNRYIATSYAADKREPSEVYGILNVAAEPGSDEFNAALEKFFEDNVFDEPSMLVVTSGATPDSFVVSATIEEVYLYLVPVEEYFL